jgi:hypothetical protein
MIWLYFFLEMCIYLIICFSPFLWAKCNGTFWKLFRILFHILLQDSTIPMYIFLLLHTLWPLWNNSNFSDSLWLDCIITTTCQLSPRLHFGKVTRGWHMPAEGGNNECPHYRALWFNGIKLDISFWFCRKCFWMPFKCRQHFKKVILCFIWQVIFKFFWLTARVQTKILLNKIP